MHNPLRPTDHPRRAKSVRISVATLTVVGLTAVAGAVTTTAAAAPRASAPTSATAAASPASDCSKNPPFNADAGSVKGLSVRGSAREVLARGLKPKAKVALINKAGRTVATKRADSLGGIVFYKVKAARGYRLHVLTGGATVRHITVHTNRSAPWDPKVYHQTIPDCGFGYLTTRDGTKLSIDVHPPSCPPAFGLPCATLPAGPDFAPPYPTLIEYAGYGYSRPSGGPESGIAVLANLMGFAVVDVNMRGSGCSGGAYNFFEPLQNLDGYDVIQTIAHQSWVKGHKVGMEGISFGAISQLFTAQTRPPALEAISPLSTIDATASTLEPGGILNTGFAVAWAAERQQNAEPAVNPKSGQDWVYPEIKSGDVTCKNNQIQHGEAEDLFKLIRANTHYHHTFADTLDPVTFVHKIDVPVFMACQWTDEQTGGHCPDLAQHFSGTKKKWFTFTNGVHTDSLDPDTFNRWYDFLSIYVAHQAPIENAAILQAASPVIYQQALGLPSSDLVTLPADPIQLQPTLAGAKAAFEKLPEIRVRFDNGAGKSPNGDFTAGNPYSGFEQSFARFPIPHTVAKKWYLGAKGALSPHKARSRGVNWYTSRAHALPLTDFIGSTEGGGLWGNASQWHWNWKQNPAGTSLSYVTPKLTKNTTVIGGGALRLWVRSSTPDVDLQVTVSEVRPDGQEEFVQNGWQRASERRPAHGKHLLFAQPSTPLQPYPSMLEQDARPMPKGKFVKVVVPLYYEGHVYRAGSRIRVTIAGPNGTQPVWSFSATRGEGSKVSVEFAKNRASSLILPVVPGVAVPTALPPCPSLRDEPCRAYRPLKNQVAKH